MKVLRFLDNHIERIICVACLVAMSTIIVLQVFFRYVLNNSLSWSEELSRYLFIWMIYIGISYGVKAGKHICVDAVYATLPHKVQKVYILFGYVLFLTFAAIMVYWGIVVVQMQIDVGQISPAIGIPMQYVYAAPAVGFSLTSIRLVQCLIEGVKAIKEKEGEV